MESMGVEELRSWCFMAVVILNLIYVKLPGSSKWTLGGLETALAIAMSLLAVWNFWRW